MNTISWKNMKLKVKIVGLKVHDVGYHVFLMEAAMVYEVPRMSAY